MADFPNIPIDASVSQLTDMILNGITRSMVDGSMSDDSVNPVQNKVVKAYVDEATQNIEINVDNEMSDTSTNPVQNKVVKNYIDENFVAKEQGKGLSTNDFTNADKTKLDNSVSKEYVDKAIEEIPAPTIDTSMSNLSTNPVQNKVIKSYADNLVTPKIDFVDYEPIIGDFKSDGSIVSSKAYVVNQELISVRIGDVIETTNDCFIQKYAIFDENNTLIKWKLVKATQLIIDYNGYIRVSFGKTGTTNLTGNEQYIYDNVQITTKGLWDIVDDLTKKLETSITIDTEMSNESTNPVQNKVVKQYVDGVNSDVVNLYDKFDTSINLYNEETVEYTNAGGVTGGVDRSIITDFIYLKKGTYLLTHFKEYGPGGGIVGFSSMEVYDISKIFIESLAIAVGENGFVQINNGVKFEIDVPCFVRFNATSSNVVNKNIMLVMATSEIQTLPTKYVPYKNELKAEYIAIDNEVEEYSDNPVSSRAVFTFVENNFVVQEQGKGLSTNDFTDEYKTKLDASVSKEYVDEQISKIEIPEGETVDLTNYYTKEEIDNKQYATQKYVDDVIGGIENGSY